MGIKVNFACLGAFLLFAVLGPAIGASAPADALVTSPVLGNVNESVLQKKPPIPADSAQTRVRQNDTAVLAPTHSASAAVAPRVGVIASPRVSSAPLEARFLSASGTVLDAALLYTAAGQAPDSAIRLGFPQGGVAPRTQELQDMLMRHQHPRGGCAGHKFVRVKQESGTAAVLHQHALGLVIALISGRIFDWHPAALRFSDLGGVSGNALHFLRPPTNCSALDAPPRNVLDVQGGSETFSHIATFNKGKRLRFSYGAAPLLPAQLFAPLAYKPFADPLTRACIAYLVRLQPAAVDRIRARRLLPGLLQSSREQGEWGSGAPGPTSLATMFPLPAWAVSLHIRHGDKGTEMRLVSTPGHFRTVAQHWAACDTPPARRVGFIWTEDPDVINFVMRRGRHAGRANASGVDDAEWLWIRAPAAGRLRTDVKQGVWRSSGRFAALADEWFLSLLLSLECGVFVGTWGSNQDRLLGELSGVLLPKAGTTNATNAVFIEATDRYDGALQTVPPGRTGAPAAISSCKSTV